MSDPRFEQEQEQAPKPETFSVRATALNDRGRVVLSEGHAAHPGGEVFIVADGRTVEVARTDSVQRLLDAGLLERVDGPDPEEHAPPIPNQPPGTAGGELLRGGDEPPADAQSPANTTPPLGSEGPLTQVDHGAEDRAAAAGEAPPAEAEAPAARPAATKGAGKNAAGGKEH